MLGAWAIAEAWQRGAAFRALAVVAALVYACPNVWAARYYTRVNYDMSRRVKSLMAHTATAHQLHPGKKLILRNVDNDLFWAAFRDRPFQILGINDIYLTEDSQAHILREEGIGTQPFMSDSVALSLLKKNQAVVYQVDRNALTNVTPLFTQMLIDTGDQALPSQIHAGSTAFEEHLGPGWYPTENERFRWMGKAASLVMRGPAGPSGTLTIRGHCPELQVMNGPLSLLITINGKPFPPSLIDKTNLAFQFSYPVPAQLTNATKMTVGLTVNRTIRLDPDTRDVGLVFGDFEVRP